MAHRLDDPKMLNTGRWKAQVDAQANGGDGTRDSDRLIACTGGSLFNLPNPTRLGDTSRAMT